MSQEFPLSSGDAAPVSVLVVEDDEALSRLLVDQLTRLGYHVRAIGDGRDAARAIAAQSSDVILLDRMLPSVDGLSLLKLLREEGVETPVILLTALGRTGERVEGLDAGADDYLVKPFELEELDARIRAVIRRRAPAASDSATVSAGDVTVSLLRHRVTRGGQPIELHKTELKILAELVRAAGSVVTRPMLLERVWGYDFEPTTNIVDSHVRRLRQKLGMPDPIVTVRGVGYMFRV